MQAQLLTKRTQFTPQPVMCEWPVRSARTGWRWRRWLQEQLGAAVARIIRIFRAIVLGTYLSYEMVRICTVVRAFALHTNA